MIILRACDVGKAVMFLLGSIRTGHFTRPHVYPLHVGDLRVDFIPMVCGCVCVSMRGDHVTGLGGWYDILYPWTFGANRNQCVRRDVAGTWRNYLYFV